MESNLCPSSTFISLNITHLNPTITFVSIINIRVQMDQQWNPTCVHRRVRGGPGCTGPPYAFPPEGGTQVGSHCIVHLCSKLPYSINSFSRRIFPELKTLEWDILNPDNLIWVSNGQTFDFLLKPFFLGYCREKSKPVF